MSTDTILSIGGNDFSDCVTRDGISVKYVPVSDDTDFTALDGSTSRGLLGYRVRLTVDLEDLSASDAAALSGLLDTDSFSVTYAFPDERTADFSIVSLEIEPMLVYGSSKYFAASLSAVSELLPPDGL